MEEDKSFSKQNDNFQTMNMIYKIKKIKKKRRLENMKKMPFPEILKNNDSDNDIEEKENEDGIEGMKDMFKENDWEGVEGGKKRGKGINITDIRQQIIDAINTVYNAIIAENKKLATTITNGLSDNDKSKETDKKIIYNFICLFESSIVSGYVVANWFFLMFYNNFSNENIPLVKFNEESLVNLPDSNFVYRIFKFLALPYIKYSLVFPVSLEYFILKFIPNNVSGKIDYRLCYILLFFLLFFLNYYLLYLIKGFLIDTINGDFKKNIIVGLMFFLVILLYFLPATTGTSTTTDNEYKDIGVKKPIHTVTGGEPPSGSQTFPWWLYSIYHILTFLFVILPISVPLGALLCLFYFVFYSIFGILYYVGLKGVSDTITKIIEFVNGSKVDPIQFPPGVEGTESAEMAVSFFQQIYDAINVIIKYIYDNFSLIIYLFLFLIFLTDSFSIKNQQLKTVSLILNSFVILCSLILLRIMMSSTKNTNAAGDGFSSIIKYTIYLAFFVCSGFIGYTTWELIKQFL